jgi:hypothetical protein
VSSRNDGKCNAKTENRQGLKACFNTINSNQRQKKSISETGGWEESRDATNKVTINKYWRDRGKQRQGLAGNSPDTGKWEKQSQTKITANDLKDETQSEKALTDHKDNRFRRPVTLCAHPLKPEHGPSASRSSSACPVSRCL